MFTPFAALLLFLGFSLTSLWAAASGIHVSCNCFGTSDRQLGKQSLVTPLMLGLAVGVYMLLPHSRDQAMPVETTFAVIGMGGGTIVYGRWLLAAPALAAVVRQRRTLENDEQRTLCHGT